MTGACRFCGQIANVPEKIENPEAADYYATSICDCSEGISFRKTEEQITGAKLRIEELFGDDCGDYGFEKPLSPEIISRLKELVEDVGRGKISTVKISFSGQGSASINTTSKGKIKVQRSIGHAYALEE